MIENHTPPYLDGRDGGYAGAFAAVRNLLEAAPELQLSIDDCVDRGSRRSGTSASFGEEWEMSDHRLVRKVVGYVVHNGRLLVFSHDDFPLDVVGIQVPAGTIEDGELPAIAAVREVLEETNLRTRVVRDLGVERYDVRPSKPEIHERHFFQLAPLGADLEEEWSAGGPSPAGDGPPQRWTCRWIPLEQAHVLCAGFGARLGRIDNRCFTGDLPARLEGGR